MRHEAVVATDAVGMTRREKLLLWASMIRAHGRTLQLYHNLEFYTPAQLTTIGIAPNDATAFGLAIQNPSFGMSDKPQSISSFMGHMELTQAQLHEFSCDCGGEISNDDMARRIEKLAG